jgi:hypothetical protein
MTPTGWGRSAIHLWCGDTILRDANKAGGVILVRVFFCKEECLKNELSCARGDRCSDPITQIVLPDNIAIFDPDSMRI